MTASIVSFSLSSSYMIIFVTFSIIIFDIAFIIHDINFSTLLNMTPLYVFLVSSTLTQHIMEKGSPGTVVPLEMIFVSHLT